MITNNKQKAIDEITLIIDKGKFVKVEQVNQTRSTRQNSALHLYFTILSQQLNDNGIDFNFENIIYGKVAMRFTPDIVKEYIWKPIQRTMFNIESTTKINTSQINEILDVLTLHFGNSGISVSFPNEFDLYLKFYEKTIKTK